MKPQLKRAHSPDVNSLEGFVPSDPDRFGVLVQLMIGPEGQDGEESFDVVVCSPRWLADRLVEMGLLDLRHHLLVKSWDWTRIRSYVEGVLATVDEPSWPQVATVVGRLGRWEFEDHIEV